MKKIIRKTIVVMLSFMLCGTAFISNVSALGVRSKDLVTDNQIIPRAFPDNYQTETVKFGGGSYSFKITLVTYHNAYSNTWHVKSYYSSGAGSSISTSSVRVGDQVSVGQRIVFSYKAHGDHLYTGSYTYTVK